MLNCPCRVIDNTDKVYLDLNAFDSVTFQPIGSVIKAKPYVSIDDAIVVEISKACDRHRKILQFIGRMPGLDNNVLPMIQLKQFEFPLYFAEIYSKYGWKTRLEMIIESQ